MAKIRAAGPLPYVRDKCSQYTFVYLIREAGDDDHCYHKIGIARDLNKRLAQLQNANGRRLVLVECWRATATSSAIAFEQTILSEFRSIRQCGEWLHGSLVKTVAFATTIRKPFWATLQPVTSEVA